MERLYAGTAPLGYIVTQRESVVEKDPTTLPTWYSARSRFQFLLGEFDSRVVMCIESRGSQSLWYSYGVFRR